MKRREVFYGDIAEMENLQVSYETGETIAEANESCQMVLQLLNRLSDKNRLTVMLHYIDGLTYKEIASIQDVPISTVKGRLYQAKKQLRGEMTSIDTLKEMAPDREFTESVVSIINRMERASEKIQSIRFVLEDATSYLETKRSSIRTIEYEAPKKYRVESESTLYISDGKKAFSVNKTENIVTISSPEHLLPIFTSEFIPQRFFLLSREKLLERFTGEMDGKTQVKNREAYILDLKDKSCDVQGPDIQTDKQPVQMGRSWHTSDITTRNFDIAVYVFRTYPMPKEISGRASLKLSVDAQTCVPIFQEFLSYQPGCGCNPQYVRTTVEVTKLQEVNGVSLPVEFEVHSGMGLHQRLAYKDISPQNGIPMGTIR